MRNLTYLESFKDDAEILKKNQDLYDEIKKNKHKEDRKELDLNEQGIFQRYQLYLNHKKNLAGIKSDSTYDPLEDIMRNSYKNSKAFQGARKKIFKSLPKGMRSLCPYCFLSESNTLDHYFPESKYVEYIIFTPNLIPCCQKCNEMKKDSVRQVVHFYFDTIPQETYMKIEIKIDESNIPVIDISLDPNTPTLIKKHFETLDLIGRYKDRCSDKLADIIETLKENFDENSYEAGIEQLKKEIKGSKKLHGENYWESCLKEAVVKNGVALKNVIATLV